MTLLPNPLRQVGVDNLRVKCMGQIDVSKEFFVFESIVNAIYNNLLELELLFEYIWLH